MTRKITFVMDGNVEADIKNELFRLNLEIPTIKPEAAINLIKDIEQKLLTELIK